MKYAPIKHMSFDWDTETHQFIFDSCGSRLEALDSLGDIIGSLNDLYEELANKYTYEDDMPMLFKIRGSQGQTNIEVLK